MRLFVGDDWAEDHHDVEVMDASGRVLARRRLPEGAAGMAGLHALIAEHADEDAEVLAGIETDRGPWVTALVAADYAVFAVNPLQASRFRDRHGTSGAKSDAADAHNLADIVRTDSHQLRRVAADSDLSEAVRMVARTHKTLVWERTRQVQRLRHLLREYFPAALEAFPELGAPDSLELLGKAPDPARAARLTRAQVSAAHRRARRRNAEDRTGAVIAALRGEQLPVAAEFAAACAASARALIAVITTLNEQAKALEGEVGAYFGRHPDAEIYLSQPGIGSVLGARVLGESGDDPGRYASAKARRNYAGTSPITRASGRKKPWRPGTPARPAAGRPPPPRPAARSTPPPAPPPTTTASAPRKSGTTTAPQVANRLVGIQHGCLKTRTLYNEKTAWSHLELPSI